MKQIVLNARQIFLLRVLGDLMESRPNQKTGETTKYYRVAYGNKVFTVSEEIGNDLKAHKIVELTLQEGTYLRFPVDENGDTVEGAEGVETPNISYVGSITKDQEIGLRKYEAELDTVALSTKANMLKGIDATNPLVAALLRVATEPTQGVQQPKTVAEPIIAE